jgi:AbrB family looped-hinge helix DNA binding protein
VNKPLSKIETAERLMKRPEGATMDEILAATGGSYQYNAIRRLEARGYAVKTRREGRSKRYFAKPPANPGYEAVVTAKGQITIPKEVRDALRLKPGQKVRFAIGDGGRATLTPVYRRLADLAGFLGKPRKSASLEEIDEGIGRAIAERYFRAAGRLAGK